MSKKLEKEPKQVELDMIRGIEASISMRYIEDGHGEFVGWFPSIKGCIAMGKTLPELKDNLLKAYAEKSKVQDWIDDKKVGLDGDSMKELGWRNEHRDTFDMGITPKGVTGYRLRDVLYRGEKGVTMYYRDSNSWTIITAEELTIFAGTIKTPKELKTLMKQLGI